VSHVQDLITKHGSNCWWELPVEDLLPSKYHTDATGTARRWEKSTDTLDVWFDSGSSWRAVLGLQLTCEEGGEDGEEGRRDTYVRPLTSHEGINARDQADLYLEGSDQHRGWFQSSLLTALSTQIDRGVPRGDGPFLAPYKCVVTHGFVLDANGRKMSKSEGNVVMPDDIINGTGHNRVNLGGDEGKRGGAGGAVKKVTMTKEQKKEMKKLKKLEKQKKKGKGEGKETIWPAYGVDVLRMWAVSNDFTRDVLLGPNAVEDASIAVRKLRNTAKFMLGNLHDYDPPLPHDASPYEGKLAAVDRLMLHRLSMFMEEVTEAYDAYAYHKVTQLVKNFVANDLSAL
jgi:isoleucyl-tRNA synthetase